VIDIVHSWQMALELNVLEIASGRRFTFGSSVYLIAKMLLGRIYGVVFGSELSGHTAGGAAIATSWRSRDRPRWQRAAVGRAKHRDRIACPGLATHA
jgi:hypothetical protein